LMKRKDNKRNAPAAKPQSRKDIRKQQKQDKKQQRN